MSPICNNNNSYQQGPRGLTSTHTFLFVSGTSTNQANPPGFIVYNQLITKNGEDIIASVPTDSILLEENKAYYISYTLSALNEADTGASSLDVVLYENGQIIEDSLVGQSVDVGDYFEVSGAIILETFESTTLQVSCNTSRRDLSANLVIIELASLRGVI